MADQSKLRKRLETLLKKTENQSCADCSKRGPRWASANLGTFFCIECSGIHRNLGVHISFVRSVNLDSWTLKQVEFMEEWGNARANAYYEAKLPRDYQKPRENDPVRVVEKFIREKYEHKRFIADTLPPLNSSAETESAAAPIKEARRSVIQPASSPAPQRTAPAPVAVAVPTKVAPKEELNLLDFFDSPVSPPPVQSAPVVTQLDPFQSGGFGQPSQPANSFFNSGPAQQDPFSLPATPFPASQQQFQDPFFSNSPAPQQQFAQAPPQQPQTPKASADAILSLYSTPQHQGGMQHGAGQGISMMMPPPNMSMGPPRGMPQGSMGYGQFPHGGMYPPQQPQYPMMGHMPQPGYPPQQYPPRGMTPGPGFQQQPNVGFGLPPQQSQGMYPNQQRW